MIHMDGFTFIYSGRVSNRIRSSVDVCMCVCLCVFGVSHTKTRKPIEMKMCFCIFCHHNRSAFLSVNLISIINMVWQVDTHWTLNTYTHTISSIVPTIAHIIAFTGDTKLCNNGKVGKKSENELNAFDSHAAFGFCGTQSVQLFK